MQASHRNPRTFLHGGIFSLLMLGSLPVAAVTVDDAWARATPPGARTAAVYMLIRGGEEADQLLGGRSDAARELQIHTHVQGDGMMRMERLPALEIGAGQRIELRPHGPHLMLIGLNGPLVAGHQLVLSLDFERAGSVELEVPVRDAR